MTRKTRNSLFVLGIMAFPFVLFLGFLIFMADETLPPVPPLPNPNGYDDFTKAETMLASTESDYTKMDEEELRAFVASNSVALQIAREGLQKQCAVPVQYSEAYIKKHLDNLTGTKRLARAFAAEGRLAEMENRPDNAAKSYLDTIHFGNEVMSGGVLVDGLVGIAVKSIGTSCLTNLVDRLDAKSCRETTAAVETLDAQSPAWNDITDEENFWSHKTFPGLRYEWMRFMTRKSQQATNQKVEQKIGAREKEIRLLMIDLATRAYELDKGKPPASASDLVPDYLKAVPQDPLTGANMVYSPK